MSGNKDSWWRRWGRRGASPGLDQVRTEFATAGVELTVPLQPAQVAAFETAHRITLPDGYRSLLTEVGSQGPSPDGPLVPLADATYPGARPDLPSPLTPGLSGDWPRTVPPEELRNGVLRLAGSWEQDQADEHSIAFDVVLVVTGPSRGRVAYVAWDGDLPVRFAPGDVLDWYATWARRRAAGVVLDEVVDWQPEDADGLLAVAGGTGFTIDERLRAFRLLGTTAPVGSPQLERMHALALGEQDPYVAVPALTRLLELTALGCAVCPGGAAPCPQATRAALQQLGELPDVMADQLAGTLRRLGVPVPVPEDPEEQEPRVAPGVRAMVLADANPATIVRAINDPDGPGLDDELTAVALGSSHEKVLLTVLETLRGTTVLPDGLYSHPNPTIRRLAVRKQPVDALLRDLPVLTELVVQEEDTFVREVWADTVADTRDPAAAGFLGAVLAHDTNERVLTIALRAAGILALSELFDLVLPYAGSDELGLRYTAAIALGNLGLEAARPALERLTTEEATKTYRAYTLPEAAELALEKLDAVALKSDDEDVLLRVLASIEVPAPPGRPPRVIPGSLLLHPTPRSGGTPSANSTRRDC